MKRLLDLPFLVFLLGLSAFVMLLPAAHAAVDRQYAVARGFFYSAAIVMLLAGLIGIATANRPPRLSARNHLSLLVAAYAVLPLALALPIVRAVDGVTLWQAWFEMLSAFTTTGATLFQPEALPATVHLWRALVGWLGGFYILVMALAVLAPLNLGGVEVATGRNPGYGAAGATPITRIA
ncbi:MAG: TrkH family potassium uptake protein, partial [Paracoccaceae bacterium]